MEKGGHIVTYVPQYVASMPKIFGPTKRLEDLPYDRAWTADLGKKTRAALLRNARDMEVVENFPRKIVAQK